MHCFLSISYKYIKHATALGFIVEISKKRKYSKLYNLYHIQIRFNVSGGIAESGDLFVTTLLSVSLLQISRYVAALSKA